MLSSYWAWCHEVRAARPHTSIRGFKYKVPVPDDIPSAVRAVLTLPDYATCKAFCRLRANDREAGKQDKHVQLLHELLSPLRLDATIKVVMTLQFISEGVPFADNVRLQAW